MQISTDKFHQPACKRTFTMSVMVSYLTVAGWPEEVRIPAEFFHLLMQFTAQSGLLHRIGKDDDGEYIVIGRSNVRPFMPPSVYSEPVDLTPIFERDVAEL